ncbi:HOOK protein-domain-containing protein [Polychytrium aggregatum]|uniref:HOOK protein-domain-containing protein n=1 Tax=Polychytrium aggregatum TaxID=110093 RepID=UPI0022FE6B1A|nr:HOOK protein-domain-containing protein [Polychytrium aggregatum]KAI9209772.1 HOOK protein-domain-containing protein [Polychytrium aggregatum]
MEPQQLEWAFIQWINTFDNLPRECHQIEDLSDGSILLDILMDIDSGWFKSIRAVEAGDNWVLKFNNLKKLHKLLLGYYEQILGQITTGLAAPNVTAIARDADVSETLKLVQLVLALAVQCENNQKYIARIQMLDQESQHILMLCIETAMEKLRNGSSGFRLTPLTPRDELDGFGQSDLLNQKAQLERDNLALTQELSNLRNQYEELETDKLEAESKLKDLENAAMDMSEAGSADLILRSEINKLKAELEKSENKRIDYEQTVEIQTTRINDLIRKLDDTKKLADEASILRDQVEEFGHLADRLQKSEAMLEKYKKRLEESADLRKQMRSVEDQNNLLNQRIVQLEDDNRKMIAFRSLMDTYKEQIGTLEQKNSTLQVDNSRLDFELKDARGKVERLELERREDMERISNLEDQLREVELGGTSTHALSKDLESTPDTNVPALHRRIAELQNQVEHLKSVDVNGERISVLESLLEDSNRLKSKFETDYMQAFQRNLALENEIQQLKAVNEANSQASKPEPVASADKSGHDQTLQIQILKKRVAELERALSETQLTAQTPAPMTSMTSSSFMVSTPNHVDFDKLRRQQDTLSEENRFQMAQLNKLSVEKDSLQSALLEVREQLIQTERVNQNLKAALTAVETKGSVSTEETAQRLALATQKIVQLSEQSQQLHTALRKSKEHILAQDKQIRDLRSNAQENYAEAIVSLEVQLKEREEELKRAQNELLDTRNAAKREQKLMISAWNNLGMEVQHKKLLTTSTGTGRGIGAGFMGTTSMGLSNSWLAQQRKQIELNIRGR